MENLTVEQVKLLHNKLIIRTGGSAGIRNEGLIDSAINRGISTFDGAYLYTSDIAKISAITHSLISNHGFIDGNKRIGVSGMVLLLKMNNIFIKYTQNELIELALGVASSQLGYEDIESWINKHVI